MAEAGPCNTRLCAYMGSDMQLVHSGVDALYLSVNCILPLDLLNALAAAKAKAVESGCEEPLALAGCRVPMLVGNRGASGGYAYVAHTGSVGELFSFRDEPVRCDWNIFVKPRAVTLLSLGFDGALRQIFSVLEKLHVRTADHSVNRVDYACDVRVEDFKLRAEDFIAHPRAKRRVYWDAADSAGRANGPRAVFQGDSLQTVTIGTMPGYQVSVYNKTAQLCGADKKIWEEAWSPVGEPSASVWRVELRAGRTALRLFKIRNLESLEASLRPMLISQLGSVRYVDDTHTDSNVSRRRLHPLWVTVRSHVETGHLMHPVGKIAPCRVIQLDREQQRLQHESMIAGNAASIAALEGMNDAAVRTSLPKMVEAIIEKGTRHKDSSVMKSVRRARKRHLAEDRPIK